MLLERTSFLIKERAGLLQIVNTFDIFDPQTGLQIGIAQERPGGLTVALSFLFGKELLPTRVDVHEDERRPPVLVLRKGFNLLWASIDVLDGSMRVIGRFRRKFKLVGAAFTVHDITGRQFGEVGGDWKGWHFQFLGVSGRPLGQITKQWAGIGKELLTSADNYVVTVEPGARVPAGLLLAAGLAIDLIFKERD